MNRYRNARLVVVASTLHSEGGDWRSIYLLARHMELNGDVVPLINLGSKRSFRQMVAALVFGQRILVNGLGTAMRWPILFACLIRSDIAIYLHETEYMLDLAKKEYPMRYRILKKILGRNRLMCVSKQAALLYKKRYGATNTHVVYECPGIASKAARFDAEKIHIVMVGSMNERKGVELFSEVADLAAVKNQDWQLHWVGGVATMGSIYRSPKVIWHGWQWVPQDIVDHCELFFLSSVDDPCPLSALEAGGMGKRIVAYRKTGTAEIIDGLKGCRVFNNYDAESARSSIADALGDSGKVEQSIRDAVAGVSGIDAFSEKIEKVMQ